MRLNHRERALIRTALQIAVEDGSIYPTGEDDEETERLTKQVLADIEAIKAKLKVLK